MVCAGGEKEIFLRCGFVRLIIQQIRDFAQIADVFFSILKAQVGICQPLIYKQFCFVVNII
jgi:hypothetical protein